MKRLFAITLVMLLSSAMFFVVVSAGGGLVTKSMTAKWTGTLYDVGICPFDPDKILTVNVGNGVASGPLGSSNFLFVYCIDPIKLEGYGWGIITTAKGDKLHVYVSNLMVNTAEDPPKWSQVEVIVGGTGMLEGAIGTSFSDGTWTSGAARFPGVYSDGPPPGYPLPTPPPLFDPAQGWVGTTIGEITF